MSEVTDLQQARQAIEQLGPQRPGTAALSESTALTEGTTLTERTALTAAIRQALAVPGPAGDPEVVRQRAHAYRATAGATLQQAGRLLAGWAADLTRAQQTDAQGRAALEQALDTVQQGGAGAASQARPAALHGVNSRLAAAHRAAQRVIVTAHELNRLTAGSDAAPDTGAGPDPETDTDPADEAGAILTDRQLERAGCIFDLLDGADQAAFSALLADARSPQEAAHLWKALAAGHAIPDIQRFDAGIHPYGADPAWLAAHLLPADGEQFGTGHQAGGDCVAASTVLAQARLDPLLMYQLTTGGTPDRPGADSPDAFHRRLRQLCQGHHRQLRPTGGTLLADQALGTATGNSYEYVGLHTGGERQAAVRRIENAVDQGLPVPIDVNEGAVGRQLMIIGRNGSELEVYHPRGRTAWVTEDQFVNGRLGALTGDQHHADDTDPAAGSDADAYAVELPT
ncbi:hypothetical protein [Kitasatospora sp. LaBMicrA B282]|uniref:hypothetical protein n=1 Tax=Kitasatospora sp. LaBMicrA B282 TaxID=3420949 RepID=UPI003D09CE3B